MTSPGSCSAQWRCRADHGKPLSAAAAICGNRTCGVQWRSESVRHIGSRLTVAVILALMVTLWPLAQAAEDDAVVVRTRIVPEGEIWVGQKVTLQIDVLARAGWPKVRIGGLEVPGAYVLRLQSQGTRLNETLDGESVQGQGYELYLYPQRRGAFAAPGIELDVEVSAWGADGVPVSMQLVTDPIRFTASTPPGAGGKIGLVTTRRLQGAQQWQPDSGRAVVGDAVERRVSLTAEDVPGMAFAPLQWDAPSGVSVYAQPPEVDDRFNRGALSGVRSESVTYVFEQPGRVSLPAVSIPWWNPEREELQSLELPGLELEVAPVAAGEQARREESAVQQSVEGDRLRWWMLFGLIGVGVIAGFHYRSVVAARWKRWRRNRYESEPAYFARFRRTAREHDPQPVASSLMHWLDRIETDPRAARLDLFLEAYGDEVARRSAQALWRAMATDAAGGFDPAELVRGITAARRCWRAADRRSVTPGGALPGLNP